MRKRIVTLMLAMMMAVGSFVGSGVTAEAAKASKAPKVSSQDKAIDNAIIALFDAAYYLEKNKDVKDAYLKTHPNATEAALHKFALEHFKLFGIKEGRDASATFNVSAYAAANPDLVAAFGTNVGLYFLHAKTFATETRIKTVAEAVKAGITVKNVSNAEQIIAAPVKAVKPVASSGSGSSSPAPSRPSTPSKSAPKEEEVPEVVVEKVADKWKGNTEWIEEAFEEFVTFKGDAGNINHESFETECEEMYNVMCAYIYSVISEYDEAFNK